MYDRLFSPVTIRGLELKNRVVLPAMGTRMAGEKGRNYTETRCLPCSQGGRRLRLKHCGGSRGTYAQCTGTLCVHQ